MHHAPNTLSIATWNVNSVRTRLPHLLQWLREASPDIALLQELKCTDDAFPRLEVEDLGYNLALHGEKTYNGVAILSKFPLEDVRRGLPGDDADTQARYVEAVVGIGDSGLGIRGKTLNPNPQSPIPSVIRIASVYVPNGQETGSDKFAYKLRFLDRLRAHLQTLRAFEEMLVVGGDYNVAPFAVDVHDPKLWEKSVLFDLQARGKLRALLNDGLYDAFRLIRDRESGIRHQENLDTRSPIPDASYSWWDYRDNAFPKNNGLRIDHLLLSPQAADHCSGCEIHKQFRELEKPSDHAPVVARFQMSNIKGQN